MLPQSLTAQAEGEEEPASVSLTGWSCPEYLADEQGAWPRSGEYTFTASVPVGYAFAEAPSVTVRITGLADLLVNDYELTTDGNVITYTFDKFSASGGSCQNNAYRFWMDVKEKIETADPGDTIKTNARIYDQMPRSVMGTLRNADGVTLHITWNGGEDLIIPSAAALRGDTGRIYSPLSYLKGLDFIPSEALEDTGNLNPEIGGVVEITAPVTDNSAINLSGELEITTPEQSLDETPA